MKRTKLKLSKIGDEPEIFSSIQGEGLNTGKPSIFIRLSLCNLHCVWCDTDYTWNWEGVKHIHNNELRDSYKKYIKREQIIKMSVSSIVNTLADINCRSVVITGGEPMIQQKQLINLMKILKNIDNKYFFEIETNGTFIPTLEFDQLINQYNVSPKLNNSGNNKRLREKSNAIKYFSSSKKSNFKFVVKYREELSEILSFIKRYNITSSKVLLMPEGRTKKELDLKTIWLVELCKQYNFTYSDRLHIRIFGDKRGV